MLFATIEKVASVQRLEVCATKYNRLRRLTHDLLEEEALRAFRIKILVRNIDDDALAVVDGHWSVIGRKELFAWRDRILPVLLKSHPRALRLALWSEGRLCGLAVARLSDSKAWISLTHIEGSPDSSHPLKGLVAPIALVGADIYRSLVENEDSLGRRTCVRIMNPLAESIDWYAKCGYSTLVRANGYTYATGFQGETE